jgi:hypothetical protein
MKKLFSILLILVSFAAFSQQKVMTTGYKYIKNDVAAWSVSSGTFVNGGTFPNDYIRCNVAGVMSIPSTQAYGEWYFDFYKGADANTMEVAFIASAVGDQTTYNGYFFRFFGTGESVRISRSTIGSVTSLFVTATEYCSNTMWYQFKITRSATGVFTAYVKGGVYGNIWTLISVAGGVGTNPVTDNTYTTSIYLTFKAMAGDRIANVRFKLSTGYNTVIK